LDAPNDRQKTPKDPQETIDNLQDTCQVPQELGKMTEFSWKNLTFCDENLCLIASDGRSREEHAARTQNA
jgi:hypothetical protein